MTTPRFSYDQLCRETNEGPPPQRPSAPPIPPAHSIENEIEIVVAHAMPNGLIVDQEALDIIESTPDGEVIDWTDIERNGPPSSAYVVRCGRFVITPARWKQIRQRMAS